MNIDLLNCVQTCDLAGAAVQAAACIQSCVVQHTECSFDELSGTDDQDSLPQYVSILIAILLVSFSRLKAVSVPGPLEFTLIG